MAIAEMPKGVQGTLQRARDYFTQNPIKVLRDFRNSHLQPHELNGSHNGTERNGQLPLSERVRVSMPSEWVLRVEGYDPNEEERWRRRFTLSNGDLTIVPRIDRSPPIVKKRGLYEKKPQEPDDEEFSVPSGLNLPDFTDSALRFGESDLRRDLTTLVREFNYRDQLLTTSYVARDADGRTVEITTDEFLSLADSVYVRRTSFKPQDSDEVSIGLGVNRYVDNNGHEFYRGGDARAPEGHFGILYTTDTAYQGHQVVIGKRINFIDEQGQDVHPHRAYIVKDAMADTKIAYHQTTLPTQADQTISVVEITHVHSTVDKKRVDSEGGERGEEIAKALDYDRLLARHKEAWDGRRKINELHIEGDTQMQEVLRFNHMHVMTEVKEGNDQAGPAPKKGAKTAYGERSFWDYIFMRHALTPEQFRTILEFRYNLLPAGRDKAQKYFDKVSQTQALSWPFRRGIFPPWEAHFAGERPENGEGGPHWVRNKLGRIDPIESIEQEIHNSGADAFVVMDHFWRTNDWEFLREKGAEIILEAARFYASRAVYNAAMDRYEYHGVTGPDEYHPDVNNNGYTNGIARWTMMQMLELIDTGMVSDELRRKIDLRDEEIQAIRERVAKVYIPFDPQTLILQQFDAYDRLENVDLNRYSGVTAMDERLRLERMPEGKKDEELSPLERNPIRTTNVSKQADPTLLLDLLGTEFLRILPEDVVAKLRASGQTDSEIMEQICRANYNKYDPHICDGSSLSPNQRKLSALHAGVSPDLVYPVIREAAMIDWHEGGNTHKTEDGLHLAAMAQSIEVGKVLVGARRTRDALVVNPKLPSHLPGGHDRDVFHGEQYQVDINRASNILAVTLINPSEDAFVPVDIRGSRFVLNAQNRRLVVPFIDALYQNGHNGHVISGAQELRSAAS